MSLLKYDTALDVRTRPTRGAADLVAKGHTSSHLKKKSEPRKHNTTRTPRSKGPTQSKHKKPHRSRQRLSYYLESVIDHQNAADKIRGGPVVSRRKQAEGRATGRGRSSKLSSVFEGRDDAAPDKTNRQGLRERKIPLLLL